MGKDITDYALREENRRIRKALKYIYKEVLAAVSVKAYSLKTLKELDYPYAKRHGRIQKSKIAPLYVYNVHERSGDFKKGFKTKFRKGTRSVEALGKIYYDFGSGSQWAAAVFKGSKKMIKRNPIQGVMRTARVRKNVLTILYGTRASSRGFTS